MDQLTFTEQDKELAYKFAGYLGQMKVPDLPMSKLSDFYSCMVWYNQLLKKIEANIFEVKSIKEEVPAPAPEEKQTKKSGKESK
jgi:hypothetical protein